MQIGDINVVDSILNLEKQIIVLQRTLVYIIENNKSNLNTPSIKVIDEFGDMAITELQKKYPNMKIQKK